MLRLPGLAEVTGRVRRRWSEPTFGFAGRVGAFLQAVASDEPLALWRRTIELEWDMVRRHGPAFTFDFAAVVLHLLAWLLAREARAASVAAARRWIDDALARAVGPLPPSPPARRET